MALILQSSQKLAIGKIFLGSVPIAIAYLGNQLVFNGEQWLNCLISNDYVYLLSKDGFKLQPRMEA